MAFTTVLSLSCALVSPTADVAKFADPVPAEQAVKAFQLSKGLTIELVASEPLVTDPVAITFDARGRLYVAEYRDYPNGPGEGKPPTSRIRLLEDTDGDGRMDRVRTFADNLNFAQGLMAYRGGLLVTSQNQIMYLKDTDGDDRADRIEPLFLVDLSRANPQLRMAHPRWGLDNWIYITNGLGGGEVASAQNPQKKISILRHDFRFDPRTLAFEPATGFGQFGNTFDDYGNRYYCSNRNPTMVTVLPYRAIARNPNAIIGQGYEDAAPAGGDAKVYPIAKTLTTAYSHTGTHTAACGVTVYRGELLGKEYTNNVFVCEPTGYLVTRSILKPRGVSMTAERAAPKVDFLASADTWFRPVSLSNGPDGALYVVDMYRAVVEHPEYMVGYFSKEFIGSINFRLGEDRGRIYRIKAAGARPRPFTPPHSTADLVALLSDPNGWRRDLGQQLLVERQATDAVPALRELLLNGPEALPRLHALATLDGFSALEPELLLKALFDRDDHVRERAVAIAAGRLDSDKRLLGRLNVLADKATPRVRLQVALALGESNDRSATATLTKIAKADVGDPWMRRAILTSVKDRAGVVLAQLLADPAFAATADADRIDLVVSLAEVAGARGAEAELAELLERLGNGPPAGVWWQPAILSGLAKGLARHQGPLGRTSLPRLLASPPARLAKESAKAKEVLDRTVRLSSDAARPVGDRVAAARLLAYQPLDKAVAVLPDLLSTAQPVEVQRACVEAIGAMNNDRAAALLIDRWPSISPSIQPAALDLLLRKTSTIVAALVAMEEGKINPAVVNLDERTRLSRLKDPKIEALAEKLFGGAASADRKAVLEQYRVAAAGTGDATAGRAAFQKVCANCHRINGLGNEVGPDISDVRNKTREVLLSDILDPNRAVDPRYLDYVVATSDGRVLTGILVSESEAAIVLRRAEGKEDVVPRRDVESMRASGKSLMPEGVEKDLSVREVTDLIEFLKQQQ
jgi:putative membrane-bound dehydrogenase-like protein